MNLRLFKLMMVFRSFLMLDRFLSFGRFVAQRFVEGRSLQVASALAYTTLLSLVPLMALVFNTLAAFPAFTEMQAEIQDFIFSNLMPASGEVIQNYLQSFTQQTSKLTAIGMSALIATALLTLNTIDNALNSIWHTRRRRRAVRSFMVYWAALTLGPLLIGVSLFVTSYLVSLPLFSGLEQTTWQSLLAWLPFFTTGLAFTLLYVLIPNRNVPWRPALLGGVLAAVLFEAAKKGFAIYITHSSAYQTIYGTLATIPIFLLWIYVSWVIILFGAQITYCLTSFKWGGREYQAHDSDSGFMQAYRLLGHLWNAQCRGRALPLESIRGMESGGNEEQLLRLLETLERAHWVYRNEDAHWGLARDLGETRLIELYRLMSGGLSSLPQDTDAWSRNLHALLVQVNSQNAEVMNLPLKDLYQNRAE